jgi:hypothetical protein
MFWNVGELPQAVRHDWKWVPGYCAACPVAREPTRLRHEMNAGGGNNVSAIELFLERAAKRRKNAAHGASRGKGSKSRHKPRRGERNILHEEQYANRSQSEAVNATRESRQACAGCNNQRDSSRDVTLRARCSNSLSGLSHVRLHSNHPGVDHVRTSRSLCCRPSRTR